MSVVRDRLRAMRHRILEEGPISLSREEALLLLAAVDAAISWSESRSREDHARLELAIGELRRIGAM